MKAGTSLLGSLLQSEYFYSGKSEKHTERLKQRAMHFVRENTPIYCI